MARSSTLRRSNTNLCRDARLERLCLCCCNHLTRGYIITGVGLCKPSPMIHFRVKEPPSNPYRPEKQRGRNAGADCTVASEGINPLRRNSARDFSKQPSKPTLVSSRTVLFRVGGTGPFGHVTRAPRKARRDFFYLSHESLRILCWKGCMRGVLLRGKVLRKSLPLVSTGLDALAWQESS